MKLLLEKIQPCPFQLDRSLYCKTIPVLSARVPAAAISILRSALPAGTTLNVPRVKPIVADDDSPAHRHYLLSHLFGKVEDIPEDAMQIFRRDDIRADIVAKLLTLDYHYWTAEDVLRASLPDDVVVPSGFEIVGHIAHLNLSAEHQPFKSLIGQVILDKNGALRTVVAKEGAIDSVFRFFQIELLAGDPDYCVRVCQSGCVFRFDYSQVYWNSRLQFEHERLVNKYIAKGDIVCDVFAGVGPFAIPAAKKRAVVYANDLNPAAHKACIENALKNKVTIKSFNLDGRDFIKKSVEFIDAGDPSAKVHYIMNLPVLASEFCGAFEEIKFRDAARVHVHCYTFCHPDEDPVAKIALGIDLVELHRVRSVAPNKDMYCVTFKLARNDAKKQRITGE